MFIELNKEWFDEKSLEDAYDYQDEPYTEFIDSIVDDIVQGVYNELQEVLVKIGYPDGSQMLLMDEVTRVRNDDFLLLNLEHTVWKHRYVIFIKLLNEEKREHFDQVVTTIKDHPSYMEENNALTLVGIVDPDVEQCQTCGG